MKCKQFSWIPVIFLLLLTLTGLVVKAVDEDSRTLFDLGTLNWLQYQKIQFSNNVYEVKIHDSTFQPANLEILLKNRNIHGKLIIENSDDISHRIVFEQHIGNELSYDIRSPVISPGERWALELQTDGIYPFRCTLHPDKMQGMLQVWYEEGDFW